MSRRSLVTGVAATAAVAGSGLIGGAAQAAPSSAAKGANDASFATYVTVAAGVDVFVRDYNGGDRGTIVLVPGWPLGADTFEYQYLFFADRGYRVIGIDNRGFGRSDAPYGPYNYDVWAADIEKVLHTLRLRNVTLLGHSMGGAIALHHAGRYGDRLGRLVLAGAAAPKFISGPKADDIAASVASLIAGIATNRPATVRGFAPAFFATHTDPDTDPFLQYFMRQCLDEASPQASRAGMYALRDGDTTADLARVKVPTLVLHSRNDQVVPFDHGERLAASIRNATLIPFDKGGHGLYVDETAKFNQAVLDFVGSKR